MANSLSAGGTSVAKDDDPELIEAAAPFSLKLIDTLLEDLPRHRPLLTTAARQYTQYAYAFLQQEADFIEDQDYERAKHLRGRTVKLYRRARDYGLRGLDTRFSGFSDAARSGKNLESFLKKCKPQDVELLYWVGASWSALISLSKSDPASLAALPRAEALMRRALELDPDWNHGALQEFFGTFEASRPILMGGSMEKAEKHFARALELTQGEKASVYVAMAEALAIPAQDKKRFDDLLQKAFVVPLDKHPEWRLENEIALLRARWLKKRENMLFVE